MTDAPIPAAPAAPAPAPAPAAPQPAAPVAPAPAAPAEKPAPEAPQAPVEPVHEFKVPESATAEHHVHPSQLPVAARPCPAGPEDRHGHTKFTA